MVPSVAQDPTGTIGGTLTRDVLDAEPELRQGSVLLLRRVAVLRTPPPRVLSHLCITLDAVLRVIPPVPLPTGRTAAAQPTLPCLLPPPAIPPPARTATQHPPDAPRAAGDQPCAAHPAACKAPALPSFAWPKLAARTFADVPVLGGAAVASLQAQQQPSASAAWPSIGVLPCTAVRHGTPLARQGSTARQHVAPPPDEPLAWAAAPELEQQQMLPASGLATACPATQWCHARQDDASSASLRAAPGVQASPAVAEACQRQGGASAGWLQGLLAEAEHDPFSGSQGLCQPSTDGGRCVLSEVVLQEHQHHHQQRQLAARPAAKRLCTAVEPTAGAVTGGFEELDLDE